MRKDIKAILKTELRGAIEGEMSVVRAHIRTAEMELKSYQLTLTRDLTTLKGTVRKITQSLSSYADDVVALQ